jgi:hypothetical protein
MRWRLCAELTQGRTGLSKGHSAVSGAESITKPVDAVSRIAVQRQAEATHDEGLCTRPRSGEAPLVRPSGRAEKAWVRCAPIRLRRGLRAEKAFCLGLGKFEPCAAKLFGASRQRARCPSSVCGRWRACGRRQSCCERLHRSNCRRHYRSNRQRHPRSWRGGHYRSKRERRRQSNHR